MSAAGSSNEQSPVDGLPTTSQESEIAVPVATSEAAEQESVSDPIVWQPLTLNGVAAFSSTTLSRVLIVQLIVALLSGVSVLWFIDRNYTPTLVKAIQKFEEGAALRYGTLRGAESGVLAESSFLTITIELDPTESSGQSSDMQVEFHRNGLKICSVFRSVLGFWELGYPLNTFMPLSPNLLEPWWGAWHPLIYLGIVLIVAAALMATWGALALVYMFPVRIIAYYADREMTLGGAWRVASMALMPGAFTMIASILLYATEWIDLIGLFACVLLHFIVGWLYVLIAPCHVKKASAEEPANNPFAKL